ncbi:hypothetical protein KR067_007719 [Drosophila pandora]|nr:hypothetical protein KR067_007719 [Drosophila pandora]
MAAKCSCAGHSLGGQNKEVFCTGPLLDTVQRSNLFPDCKHFVDMSCIYTPAQTMADFKLFSNCRKNDGSLHFLGMFVEKHFNEPGNDLVPWTPTDWKSSPPFLAKVHDPEMKKFGSDVNAIWKDLGRKVHENVREHPDQFSIIYIPKPFIVPSVNHREYWYWDSFWIVRGLLHCGMYETAKGMIDNFLVLVRQYGFVPGCGRIYCSGRSNPPMLIMMMKSYVEVTKDEAYAIKALPLLELEYETFLHYHEVKVKGRTMYQYRDSSTGPRPEAYREDLETAEHIESPELKQALYTQLKSACESGQDFSSRWFVAADGSNRGTIADTRTSAIVPVELNAIIFRSGKILAEFHRKSGNTKRADQYQERACILVKAIRDIMWNDEAGIWLDYDLENKKPRNFFCCTNFAPLWARAFPLVDTDKVSTSVMKYIETNNLDKMYGGVPHTMNKYSYQKWDYPNSFPPMMFIVIEGLDNLGTPESKAMSKKWAHHWTKSVYAAYKNENRIFERYNCNEFGQPGDRSGNAQFTGYGWTIGVVFEFLAKHGKDMVVDPSPGGMEESTPANASIEKNEFIITSEANMDSGIDGGSGVGNQCQCSCRLSPESKDPSHATHATEHSAPLGVMQKFHTPATEGASPKCICEFPSHADSGTSTTKSEAKSVLNGTGGTCGICGNCVQDQSPPHLEGGQCSCSKDDKKDKSSQKGNSRPQGHQRQGVLCACGALLGNYGNRKDRSQPKQYEAPKPCVVTATQPEAGAGGCGCGQGPAAAPAPPPQPQSCYCSPPPQSPQSPPEPTEAGAGACGCGIGAAAAPAPPPQPQSCYCSPPPQSMQQSPPQSPQHSPQMHTVLSEHDPSCACYIARKQMEAEKQANTHSQASQAGCCPMCSSPSQSAKSSQGSESSAAPVPSKQLAAPVPTKQSAPTCGCGGAPMPPKEQSAPAAKKVEPTPSARSLPNKSAGCCFCENDQGPNLREEEKKKFEAKMQECLKAQMSMVQERNNQIKNKEAEDLAKNCDPETKPKPQDCTSAIKASKSGQQGAVCSCAAEEEEDDEEKLKRQQEQLVGHYAPLSDGLAGEECPEGLFGKKKVKRGCCTCDTEDCPEQEAPGPVASAKAMSCSCGGGAAPPPTTFLCPHCGGNQNEPGTRSVGTNRPSIPTQPSRSSPKVGGKDADCMCSASPGSPGKSGCDRCAAHLTSDYSPDNGRTPVFNKQFPLKDRDGDECDNLPDPNAGKDKKKCCNCEKEEEQE